MNVLRTILIPAGLAPLARALAAGLSPTGQGMFVRGLAPSNESEPTHYVSSGHIGEDFADMITAADKLHAACGGQATLADCQALVSQSIVSDGFHEIDGEQVAEDPFALFSRLGLVLL